VWTVQYRFLSSYAFNLKIICRRQGVDVGGGMLCRERRRKDIIIQPSGIRLPWVFHHLSPIQLVSHLNGNIRLSFGGSSSFSSCSPHQFCLAVDDKGTREEKPFCCVCRRPIKLPVAVNLLQQQQKLRQPFDQGIFFFPSIFCSF